MIMAGVSAEVDGNKALGDKEADALYSMWELAIRACPEKFLDDMPLLDDITALWTTAKRRILEGEAEEAPLRGKINIYKKQILDAEYALSVTIYPDGLDASLNAYFCFGLKTEQDEPLFITLAGGDDDEGRYALVALQ